MVVSTLLHNGSTFRQSTSAPDNQVQVFTISVPRSFSTNVFSKGRVDTGCVDPSPKDPACCFPAEVWHEEVRPQETLSLLVPAPAEWHMSCGGGEHGTQKEQRHGHFRIFIHSGTLVAIHRSHSVSSIEWLPPAAPRDVCSILWRKKGPVPFYSNNIYEVLSMCKGLCKTPGINLWGKPKRVLTFTQLFSTDVLTANYVLDNVLGVKSNSSEENTVSAPKLETALQWEK